MEQIDVKAQLQEQNKQQNYGKYNGFSMFAILSRLKRDICQVRCALIVFLVYAVPAQCFFHTTCPFAILTGFSCPGCGLTRAGIHLLKGEFSAALELHPMIFLWVLLLLYFFIFRYILGRRIRLALPLVLLSSLATLVHYFCRLSVGIQVPVSCEGILRLVL